MVIYFTICNYYYAIGTFLSTLKKNVKCLYIAQKESKHFEYYYRYHV